MLVAAENSKSNEIYNHNSEEDNISVIEKYRSVKNPFLYIFNMCRIYFILIIQRCKRSAPLLANKLSKIFKS